MPSADTERVYATRGLVEVLCELAADAEPRELTVAVAATAAGDLDADLGTDFGTEPGPGMESGPGAEPDPGAESDPDADPGLSATTPVFTDFYLPDAGNSVSKVFGVDLGVPVGQTHGRFVSHPLGEREVSLTDDLAATMFVAVPPWEPEEVAAFDRSGRRLALVLVDAEPPERSVA